MATENSKGARRFVGWQKTPIQQASFGSTTKGGRRKSFEIKGARGSLKLESMKTYLLDASLVPVGRLATVAASLLSGKHKPSFTPGANSGDQVVVINANRAFFSSNKAEKKIYYWHTGWMGGLKMRTAGEALERNPERVIFEAVEGMLPKNRLSQRQLVHLKIYKTADHPHQAQKPYALTEEHFGLKKLGLGD